MPYLRLSDFRSGVDTTRPEYAAEPDTLIECVNGHITRGGDIERRLPFDPLYTLPAGTHGLHTVGTKLFVYGSVAPPGVPAGVTYQRLESPTGSAMVAILDAENFGGAPYVIAEYDDGAICHFYNGSRVTEWDTISIGDTAIEDIAEYLAFKIDLDSTFTASAVDGTITVIAAEPGTPFTISGSATNGGATDDNTLTITQIQANVPATDETRATASFEVTGGTLGDAAANAIDGLTIDGTDLIDGGIINWIDSHDFTAALVAQAINAESDVTGYSASAAGAVVTITAPSGTGALANGDVLAVSVAGNVTVGSVADMSGGISTVAAVAQIEEVTVGGTIEAADSWLISLNSVEYRTLGNTPGMGTALKTHQSKMYAAAGRKLRFSAIDNVLDWTTTNDGAGFVAFANQDGTSERLIGIDTFLEDLAVFARRAVQIEAVDPDPALNSLITTLHNTGALSAKSVINYANTDIFYLSDAGIRSIRPRATTDTAFADDIGVNIDVSVAGALQGATAAQIRNAVSVLEPTHSRFLLAIADTVFVLSFFPGKRIAAWTTYDLGFEIEDFAVIGRLLYARAGDTIYAYGGSTGLRTPDLGEVTLTVKTPFLPADRDPLHKALRGFDLAAKGEWNVTVNLDPNNPASKTSTAVVEFITHPYGRVPMEARSSHFQVDLTSNDAGEVSLSSLILHFEAGEEQ